MEFYGLRKSGDDIDYIVHEKDFKNLLIKYSDSLKNLWGDLGIVIGKYEIWKSINWLGYNDLVKDAIEEKNVFIINLEKLLLLKSLGNLDKEKYKIDTKLIIEKIKSSLDKRKEEIISKNKKLLNGVKVRWIEKIGNL